MDKVDLFDLTFADLEALLKDMGQPKFRAKQIWEWLYQHYAAAPEDMTNLPKALRTKLSEGTMVGKIKPVFTEFSSDGFTEKVL
ncbi:MAG: 23S rRNA (adenine(2503)-C(2))-methyltransferase RlmN, partial [Chloroflexota bacterium]